MKRRHAVLWFIAIGAASATPALRVLGHDLRATQGQGAVFRSGADLVTVDVAVRRGGRPVSGLGIHEFDVIDNGVVQQVAEMSYEKLPIDVTMALDVSESVTGALLDRLRRGVQQLVTDLGAHDRLKLMTFNMRVRRAMDFGKPASSTDAAFGKIAAFGSTAAFDTLAVALSTAAPPDRRQLIVLFSDGHDTSSITDPATLIDVAHRTTATLGFVLPLVAPLIPSALPAITPGSPTVTIARSPAGMDVATPAIYSRLAMETGGVVVRALPGDNLSTTFKRILDEFRSSYVLHFTPRGVERSGVHTLDVRVKRSGVDVRARKTYVWR